MIAWQHFYAEVPANTRLATIICGGCGDRLQMMRDELMREPLETFRQQHAACADAQEPAHEVPTAAVS